MKKTLSDSLLMKCACSLIARAQRHGLEDLACRLDRAMVDLYTGRNLRAARRLISGLVTADIITEYNIQGGQS